MNRCASHFVLLSILWFNSILLAQHSRPAPGQDDEPLTIAEAVAQALEKNLDLIAERYDLPIAEARLITARVRPNPVFSLGGDHLDLLGTGYNDVNRAGPAEYSMRTDFLFERGVLSELLPMVKEGLVVVHDAEVFAPSSGDSEER